MGRGLRWPHPPGATQHSGGRRKNGSRTDQLYRDKATVTASPARLTRTPAGGFRLDCPGVRLASLNTLLAANPWARNAYARAWHDLVLTAAFELGRTTPLPRVIIEVIRQAPTLVDPDNVIAKGPIDGLRKAGLFPEDTAEFVADVRLRQARGPLHVTLVVTRAKETAPGGAE